MCQVWSFVGPYGDEAWGEVAPGASVRGGVSKQSKQGAVTVPGPSLAREMLAGAATPGRKAMNELPRKMEARSGVW